MAPRKARPYDAARKDTERPMEGREPDKRRGEPEPVEGDPQCARCKKLEEVEAVASTFPLGRVTPVGKASDPPIMEGEDKWKEP